MQFGMDGHLFYWATVIQIRGHVNTCIYLYTRQDLWLYVGKENEKSLWGFLYTGFPGWFCHESW